MRALVSSAAISSVEELQTVESQRQIPPPVAQILMPSGSSRRRRQIALQTPWTVTWSPKGCPSLKSAVAGGESHRDQQRGKEAKAGSKDTGPAYTHVNEVADSNTVAKPKSATVKVRPLGKKAS